MSNRRRVSRPARSYRAPRQRRAPATPPRRPVAAGPRRRYPPWLPAVPAVVAELGHLAAAFVEWPESAARGAYHVVTGALLGLVAAAILGTPRRWMLAAGAAVAAAGPASWLGGHLVGAAPYGSLVVPVAAGVAGVELGLAALLVTGWRQAGAPVVEPTVTPRPARSAARR